MTPKSICTWTQRTSNFDAYDSTCGAYVLFENTDHPGDADWHFCPYCGHQITVKIVPDAPKSIDALLNEVFLAIERLLDSAYFFPEEQYGAPEMLVDSDCVAALEKAYNEYPE